MDGANGMWLEPRDGQRFRFDAGTLCLEFLLTGCMEPWELLHAEGDLAAWIPSSRLRIEGPVVEESGDLASAKRLRAALFHLALAAADPAFPVPRAPEPESLAVLTGMAAAPPPAPTITAGRERGWAYPVTARQFMSAVARDAIGLFGGGDLSRIRICGGERCYLLFLDTSRPGTRRWCSMDRCGNRQKLRTRRKIAE
ncbi:CGNR zinc finger domain-containing protein [Nonomuraea longicatena]